MNPLITKSRQPLSHEWRRHSLVKVRRPAWSGHVAAATSAQNENAPAAASSEKSHTTHNDIAW